MIKIESENKRCIDKLLSSVLYLCYSAHLLSPQDLYMSALACPLLLQHGNGLRLTDTFQLNTMGTPSNENDCCNMVGKNMSQHRAGNWILYLVP